MDVAFWIAERYGTIHFDQAVTKRGDVVFVAVVAVHKGLAIGMGPSKDLAVHDLYEDLTIDRKLETKLTGVWRKRRDLRNQALLDELTKQPKR